MDAPMVCRSGDCGKAIAPAFPDFINEDDTELEPISIFKAFLATLMAALTPAITGTAATC